MITDLSDYVQMINQSCNLHDMEGVVRFYSPHCIAEDIGQATAYRGHEGLRAMLSVYWNAFPDLKFEVTDTVIQDSRLAIAWLAQGTHQGTIMNIPPTAHRVEVRGVSIIDIQEGLIVRGQYIWDLAGMLRHMGLLPAL
jgi:steroid delta-isomerase-like uncharacterized protein